MPKKEASEKEKKQENRVIAEPIDEKAKKILEATSEDEYKEAPPAEESRPAVRRRLSETERMQIEREENLAKWRPKTQLGKLVRAGQIKDIDEVFDKGYKILEFQIVDTLLPNLRSELLLIGQAKGKFGGGKRRFWRQTQKKTAEGNDPHFACMAVIGDENGHVGIGLGKARETLPAKSKAMREAKLSMISVKRGCGSFDCSCSEKHSIPFKVEGKRGSAVLKMIPAPKGTGLVAEKECRKILKLAGIKDIYTKKFGQSRTKINMAGACYNALKNISEMKR